MNSLAPIVILVILLASSCEGTKLNSQDGCGKVCGNGEICRREPRPGNSTKCVCRDNMDCPGNMNLLCGSDGKTHINECIMNATACRKKKQIHKVQEGSCIPGDICSIGPTSHCRAAFIMFYYNVDKRKCEQKTVGGCHPSGWNGFRTKNDCRRHCIRDVCTMSPDVGPCTKNKRRWYFHSAAGKCKRFKYGGCFGNPNNFRTRSDCMKRCR